jgi:hypothetical protein
VSGGVFLELGVAASTAGAILLRVDEWSLLAFGSTLKDGARQVCLDRIDDVRGEVFDTANLKHRVHIDLEAMSTDARVELRSCTEVEQKTSKIRGAVVELELDCRDMSEVALKLRSPPRWATIEYLPRYLLQQFKIYM